MSNLAIRGHATRGKEVIEILEMLGGKKIGYSGHSGFGSPYYYYIDEWNNIVGTTELSNNKAFVTYTLEEFFERFPYKVGDKVTHNMGILMNVVHMYWDAECNVIRYDIQSPVDNNYKFKAMLAEHLQPYKEENMKDKLEQITLDIPKGYEFFEINDDNQVVLAKKQLQYPKTYDECCDVLKIPNDERYIEIDVPLDYNAILYPFTELIICRNAYWKIAGEQMGLWKHWTPDWDTQGDIKYVIEVYRNKVRKNSQGYSNTTLAFPTSEMRDVFYDNFKELIETCKEFL